MGIILRSALYAVLRFGLGTVGFLIRFPGRRGRKAAVGRSAGAIGRSEEILTTAGILGTHIRQIDRRGIDQGRRIGALTPGSRRNRSVKLTGNAFGAEIAERFQRFRTGQKILIADKGGRVFFDIGRDQGNGIADELFQFAVPKPFIDKFLIELMIKGGILFVCKDPRDHRTVGHIPRPLANRSEN